MVMARLFYQSGLKHGIAHLNHGLRGQEADRDAKFVEEWAQSQGIPFFGEKVDLAREDKTNIQAAGRKARYRFLKSVATKEGYQYIVTAHHEDDQLETVIFHALRGSGVRGLRGIPMQRENIIRPLLEFSRGDLEEYAKSTGLRWREDESNKSLKYSRNRIRHELLPQLMEKYPNLRTQVLSSSGEIAKLYSECRVLMDQLWEDITHVEGDLTYIARKEMKSNTALSLFLEEKLVTYGFSHAQVAELIAIKKTGAYIESESHRIYCDREYWIIEERGSISSVLIEVNEPEELGNEQLGIKLRKLKPAEVKFTTDHRIAHLDVDTIQFPLQWRTALEGDRFRPLGMKGSMLLSDFFTQRKYSIPQKKRTLLLCKESEVLWVRGDRISENCKVKASTQKVLELEWVK